MTAWLVFVFANAANSSKPSIKEASQHLTAITNEIAQEELTGHNGAEIEQKSEEKIDKVTEKIQNNTNLSNDIKTLEAIYIQEKDIQVLKTLIEKSAQNYDFEKAAYYLQEIFTHKDYKQEISPKLHLYIALHDTNIISITDPQSIKNIIPIMEDYQNK
ncbi:hypothetical protein KKG31_00085 [Patescibacteria group bacterium]|nr:hypothetical protein [Patescibacteria group bacterium]